MWTYKHFFYLPENGSGGSPRMTYWPSENLVLTLAHRKAMLLRKCVNI